jgi:hypothetical protein
LHEKVFFSNKEKELLEASATRSYNNNWAFTICLSPMGLLSAHFLTSDNTIRFYIRHACKTYKLHCIENTSNVPQGTINKISLLSMMDGAVDAWRQRLLN